MIRLLHIETATPVCSVALSLDGEVFEELSSGEEQNHATHLTVFIQKMLDKHGLSVSNLDGISLSMGPGSYTGLRIGASVAKGLSFGSDKPVIGVGTLHALTAGLLSKYKTDLPDENSLLCPMLDARRDEVYSALFDQHMKELQPVKAEILTPDSYQQLLTRNRICFFGSGSVKAKRILPHQNAFFDYEIFPAARHQASLAYLDFQKKKFLNVAYFEPDYLKAFIATRPKNKF
ncbi:MAG: tRNA (adenosine(37)-N6)-threonylcarbamoyltransferase complex dimerization subunit type 1 TsaB [Bacteroidales bacterium]|nr:tRNA (adenosine(37)-N6)-threonylcarbamoyltransferase complex dimerization subunit type 1 TsaB [Bacteroidales bacterium]